MLIGVSRLVSYGWRSDEDGETGFYAIGIAAAEGIIIVRTYAIWGNKKIVGYALVALMCAIWIPLCTIVQVFLNSIMCESSSSLWL